MSSDDASVDEAFLRERWLSSFPRTLAFLATLFARGALDPINHLARYLDIPKWTRPDELNNWNPYNRTLNKL